MVPRSRLPPSLARRSALPQMTECSEVWAAFDNVARRWRQEFEDRDNEDWERKDLACCWQQYYEKAALDRSAILTRVTNPKRKQTVGNFWYNRGSPPQGELWP